MGAVVWFTKQLVANRDDHKHPTRKLTGFSSPKQMKRFDEKVQMSKCLSVAC
jgi:hypothetical protein